MRGYGSYNLPSQSAIQKLSISKDRAYEVVFCTFFLISLFLDEQKLCSLKMIPFTFLHNLITSVILLPRGDPVPVPPPGLHFRFPRDGMDEGLPFFQSPLAPPGLPLAAWGCA